LIDHLLYCHKIAVLQKIDNSLNILPLIQVMPPKKSEAKPKASSKAKKVVEDEKVNTASVVSAFGGSAEQSVAKLAEPLAIFIEEAPVPTPPPATKKSRRPPVVAAVTPDGIQGSLHVTEQRPLVAHLPIHKSDIDSDLFCDIKVGQEQPQGSIPTPYDPSDVFSNFANDVILMKEPGPDVKAAAPPPTASRASLPLHYSEKLMIRYQDANRDQKLPDNTDIACFWDCHSFRGTPCAIPMTIEEGIWRVYGNFCSPECASAHLFNERLDSNVQWERYALLNRLYAPTSETGIRLAPSRNIIRLFGGPLDVSDFRAINTEQRMRIDVMTPPMISIIQVMDTKPIDFYDSSMKNSFIPWEMDRMNRPGAQGLRLRRTKPITEKETTLEFCMGIAA